MDQGLSHSRRGPLKSRRTEQPVFDRIVWLSRWVELLGVAVSVVATVVAEHLVHDLTREGQIAELSGISRTDYHWILLICAAMAAWNLGAQGLGRRDLLTRSSVAGLAVDLVFVITILARTHGLQSPFYGLLFLLVMGAAVWKGVAGGIYMALVSSACVVAIEMGEILPQHAIHMVDVYTKLGAPEVFSRLPYLFLVAWLTGSVVEAFRRETERRILTERQTTRLQAEQEGITQELDAARRVQERLMPSDVPAIPGIRVAVRYQPAGAVGGDMFDFPRPSPTEIAFVLADVSGHSLPAALLVASAKGALYDTQSLPPAEMMSAINRRLLLDCGDDRFVTMVYARLDLTDRSLTWVNAGHPPPLMLRHGETWPLPGNGLILGIIPKARYEAFSLNLEPGDVLLFYSDGLMERHTTDGRMTGFEDFRAMASTIAADREVDQIAEAVLAGAERMGAVRDDVTLVVVKVAE
jgi:hypothetical protein